MGRRKLNILVLSLLVTLLAPMSALANGDHDHSKDPSKKEPPKDAAPPAVQAPDASQTGIFRWKDERGGVHYSQGLNNVPEKFRSTAVPLGPSASPVVAPAAAPAPTPSSGVRGEGGRRPPPGGD